MPSIRIHKELKDQIYFVTLTVKHWYYLFDRYDRFQILEDSFVYCQDHKDLKIYAFVFMLNHLHFIASAPDLSALLRDMKTFLSKELKENIEKTEPKVLKLFQEADGTFNFWESTNYPKMIMTEAFYGQKVEYIHYNPVRKQYVHEAEDWRWSSASKIPTKIRVSELVC